MNNEQPRPVPSAGATNGSLRWGIKSSFVKYVDSSPDGERTAEGVGESSGEDAPVFEFPCADVVSGPEAEMVLEFSGSLRFRAHRGMLDVNFAAPTVSFQNGFAEIRVLDGSGEQGRRMTIAKFAAEAPKLDAGSISIQSSEVFLTTLGSQLLGDVYPARTLLDPLVIDVRVGESAG
jgi:hypothetical protein